MLYVLVLMIHVAVCVGLILVVLMQSSKGGGLSGVFGGSSQAVFGGRGAAPALVKATSVLAITFGLTSLSLAFLATKQRVAKTAIQEEIEKGARRTSPPPGSPAQPSQGQQMPGGQPTGQPLPGGTPGPGPK
jgi:preprotein translocase subunit SecG